MWWVFELRKCAICPTVDHIENFPVNNVQFGRTYYKTICRNCWSLKVNPARATRYKTKVKPPPVKLGHLSALANSIVRRAT